MSGPLVIALTGGLCCGKSTVGRWLIQQGFPVFSADEAARTIVEPGTPLLAELARLAGEDILTPDGTLDRARLRQRIFRDPSLRRRVEACMHPAIHAHLRRQIATCSPPGVVFVELPLLAETGRPDYVDRVWVVDCTKTTQIERCRKRGLSADEVERILAAQADRSTRRAQADVIIEADGEWETVECQLSQLIETLDLKPATRH